MTDGFPPPSALVAPPPLSPVDRDLSDDPSLAWLRAMLCDAGLSAHREKPDAADDASAASIDPPARAMLGWTDERPEPGDEFAARLMAAFQSGALEIQAPVLVHSPLASSSRVEVARPENASLRPAHRAPTSFKPEAQRQGYATLGALGRSLYTPW